jgi:uncharacterized protein involved in exopolysaccharide biosynthesis/integrase
VISPVYQTQNTELDSTIQNEMLQAKKWKVLIGTFLTVLLVSQIFVWSRESVFESQATIQFSTTQVPGGESSATLIQESLQNQQRLTSNRILKAVNTNIHLNYGIQTNIELLSKMLSAELQSGQMINLKARGNNPDQLKPILSAWLEEYLKDFNAENDNNNVDSILRINKMLAALEEKISQQKIAIVTYGQDHDIVSLERNENRILNKVNSLEKLLHTAEQDYLDYQEIVSLIEYAEQEGRLIIDPKDENKLAILKENITEIEDELSNLSEKYTRKYMEKDPQIISMQNSLVNLQEQLKKDSLLSQSMFVKDAKNNLLVAKGKVAILNEQLDGLSVKAQSFNHNLKEYTRQNDSLNQLVQQAQSLKDSLLAQEMLKAGKPQFNILEYPFVPSYAIAPNNKRDALIGVIMAVVVALLALFLFSYIVRQKQVSTVFSNYAVMPNDLNGNRQLLEQQTTQRLTENQTSQSLLEQNTSGKALRLLSTEECQKLVDFANKQGKLVILLVLSGVNIRELLTIKVKDFDLDNNTLEISNQFARTIALSSDVSVLITDVMQFKNSEDNIFEKGYSLDELSHLILNSAHDAELTEPSSITLENLRHTYLIFLVEQGVKLNHLENIAGGIHPAQLALYRSHKNNVLFEQQQVKTIYPIA